ncbi:MAG: glutaminyl-peptide cyclotransferase [Anaerolineae bacterium]|nr:glutaminyl-peptide cyclotransferase [Anaerolineae bacterium]
MKRQSRLPAQFPVLLLAALIAVALAPGLAAAQSDNPMAQPVQVLVPEVISVRDHDPDAYTQGLLLHDGLFYESTGRRGASSLRAVDPATGEVERQIDVPDTYFAEGLALVDDRLIQLTWQENTAFVYDVETFEQVGTFEYEGEGWGLCYDGERLYMTDGRPFIQLRDPNTFELFFSGAVTLQGQPVGNLNELECVGDYLYANVWKTDYIVQIDKTNGVVVGVIDTSSLLTEQERAALLQSDSDAVLNGIAYDAENDVFLITGKLWPKLYEVRFVEQEQE